MVRQHLAQAGSLHQFHDDVGQVDVALIVDGHDVRMAEGGSMPGLGLEPSSQISVAGQMAMQNLDGHIPFHLVVGRVKDRAHPTGADAARQGVATG